MSGHTFHALTRFCRNQVKLCVEFTKARGHAFCTTQKTGALDGGSWIGRQRAGCSKEIVKRRAQANALVAHDIHHAFGVIDHGLLAGQVTGAVAQVRFSKRVVLALDVLQNRTRAHIHAGQFFRRRVFEHHVLA